MQKFCSKRFWVVKPFSFFRNSTTILVSQMGKYKELSAKRSKKRLEKLCWTFTKKIENLPWNTEENGVSKMLQRCDYWTNQDKMQKTLVLRRALRLTSLLTWVSSNVLLKVLVDALQLSVSLLKDLSGLVSALDLVLDNVYVLVVPAQLHRVWFWTSSIHILQNMVTKIFVFGGQTNNKSKAL